MSAERDALKTCCAAVVERYESVDRDSAEVAKSLGGVALFCPTCISRVVFSGGAWRAS